MTLAMSAHLYMHSPSGSCHAAPTLQETSAKNNEYAPHLLPSLMCASMRIASSSSLQASRFMSGRSWLCQRSRHCLPIRPGKDRAMVLHCPSPSSLTSLWRQQSAQIVNVPGLKGPRRLVW